MMSHAKSTPAPARTPKPAMVLMSDDEKATKPIAVVTEVKRVGRRFLVSE